MIQLPNFSFGHVDEQRNISRMKRMVYTKRLKFVKETDENRKTILQKMVATTQLRLALETEEERRAKNGLDLIWIEI